MWDGVGASSAAAWSRSGEPDKHWGSCHQSINTFFRSGWNSCVAAMSNEGKAIRTAHVIIQGGHVTHLRCLIDRCPHTFLYKCIIYNSAVLQQHVVLMCCLTWMKMKGSVFSLFSRVKLLLPLTRGCNMALHLCHRRHLHIYVSA